VEGNARTRVLVTGATGKIGHHVVTELLARGYQVRAVTSKRIATMPAGDRLEWCQLDFQESLDFDPLVRDCAAVIHLGAELSVIPRMQRSNVEATRALAEASERAGVRFFCYTSSVAVYGSSRRRRVREDSPVLTTDRDRRSEYWANDMLRCYGRTKLQGELAISAVAHDVEYVILRPSVVVDIEDLVKLASRSKMAKRAISAKYTHYVYIYDVADAILTFLERSLARDLRSRSVSTFNLADDDTAINTYGQIFKAAYETTGDRGWRVAPAMPGPFHWLLMVAKFRMLALRYPYGLMLFSGEKLRAAGYTFRFGMSHAFDVFLKELAAADPSPMQGPAPSSSAGLRGRAPSRG
jgi:nucleoside-diphosphate-sugar epimerase